MNLVMLLSAANVFAAAFGMLRLLGVRPAAAATGGVSAVLATGVIATLLT